MEKYGKIISTFVTKSITLDGECAHVSTYLYDNMVVVIKKEVLSNDNLSKTGFSQGVTRLGKTVWFQFMSFKANTFISIAAETQDQFKEYLKNK